MTRRFNIGFVAVAMLVLLRITIGWHFLYEGEWKRNHPGFSAEAFFNQSRGPFKQRFRDLIDDYDGRRRLDHEATTARWAAERDRVKDHYQLNDEQYAQLNGIYNAYDERLRDYLKEHEAEVLQYVRYDKLDPAQLDPASDLGKLELDRQRKDLREIPFEQQRLADREAKLRGQIAPWLVHVDGLDDDYFAEVDAFVAAIDKQRADAKLTATPLPPRARTTMERIDHWTKYGLVAIGFGLIAGLCTRLSALAGAAFLALVVLAQPAYPGVFPAPHPSAGHALLVNKEFIEMMALLALAATPVGRWGGLDFFVHHLLIRPIFGKRKPDESHA